MPRRLTKCKCSRVLYVAGEGLGVGIIKIVLTTPPQLLRAKALPRLPSSSSSCIVNSRAQGREDENERNSPRLGFFTVVAVLALLKDSRLAGHPNRADNLCFIDFNEWLALFILYQRSLNGQSRKFD